MGRVLWIELLKYCLIYTCLSNQNKCLSFIASDGHYYKNELCFDAGTMATHDLKQMSLNSDEIELVNIWNNIIAEAKTDKIFFFILSHSFLVRQVQTAHGR